MEDLQEREVKPKNKLSLSSGSSNKIDIAKVIADEDMSVGERMKKKFEKKPKEKPPKESNQKGKSKEKEEVTRNNVNSVATQKSSRLPQGLASSLLSFEELDISSSEKMNTPTSHHEADSEKIVTPILEELRSNDVDEEIVAEDIKLEPEPQEKVDIPTESEEKPSESILSSDLEEYFEDDEEIKISDVDVREEDYDEGSKEGLTSEVNDDKASSEEEIFSLDDIPYIEDYYEDESAEEISIDDEVIDDEVIDAVASANEASITQPHVAETVDAENESVDAKIAKPVKVEKRNKPEVKKEKPVKQLPSVGASDKVARLASNKKEIDVSRPKINPARTMRLVHTNSVLVRLAVEVAAILIFFTFIVRNTVVLSASMEPTLMTDDYVIFNKLAYVVNDIRRGDIVTFYSREFGEYFSKRAIGIAGDQIEFHDGYVFINGLKADESAYLAEDVETNCNKVFVVPDNCVFVLGDNRGNSYDSRFFNNPYISCDDIIGKYLGTVHKYNKK